MDMKGLKGGDWGESECEKDPWRKPKEKRGCRDGTCYLKYPLMLLSRQKQEYLATCGHARNLQISRGITFFINALLEKYESVLTCCMKVDL